MNASSVLCSNIGVRNSSVKVEISSHLFPRSALNETTYSLFSYHILLPVKFSCEALLSIFVVVLNACVLITLVRKRSLHTPSNTVLGCMCCGDLLVGLLSSLPSAILMSVLTKGGYSDNVKVIYAVITKALATLTGLSSLFMTLVNLDQYAAICHPFKYLQYTTVKRYVIIAISSFSIFSVFMMASIIVEIYSFINSEYAIFSTMFTVTILILIYCHWNILRVTARHRREIACAQRSNQNGPHRDAKRHRVIVVLVILYLLCKIPSIIYFVLVLNKAYGDGVLLMALFSNIMILLNSILNPILYCYRISVFRDAVKEVLRC